MDEIKICENLKKLYDESEDRVKADALVCRAYINKVSFDTINDKVNAQMNAVKVGIYEVNPKFKETSKDYDEIRDKVSGILANYKDTLIELGNFYDQKIEQLILRKVELEASLLGSLLNEEYLYRKINRRINQKENDEVQNTVKNKVKFFLDKIKAKKEESAPVDTNLIFKAMDAQDVIDEVEAKNSVSLIMAENNKKENQESIFKIEKEISLINSEIERLNEQKKRAIFEAMEVGGRSIAKNIRKPKVFKKITKFFICRFNTARMVEATILDPLNLRIESFRSNELSNMIG